MTKLTFRLSGKATGVFVGFMFLSSALVLLTCSKPPAPSAFQKLKSWRTGVWMSSGGTYTIYTSSHYFVISCEGDTVNANIYCAASQVEFRSGGIARQQTVRVRKLPGSTLTNSRWPTFRDDRTETPMAVDTTLFSPGTCTIKEGIIYDAVTEVTDTSILLSTCNGDKERIFSNGTSVYLSADGGEFWSFRVEAL